jgi:polyhydroxybutyrate depolymerase
MRHILTVCCSLLATMLSLAAQSTELEGVRAAADRAVKVLRADGAGLTVFRGGRELHRSLHGQFAADQVIPIASASKWLAVATIMTLVEDGTLQLEHPVARYVTEFDRDDKRRVTLRQCLSCVSGLPARMNDRMRGWDMDRFAEEAADEALRTGPNDAFRYGGVGFQVVALCAVRATGESWHDLFRKRIGDRLGMRDTHFGALHPIAAEPGKAALPWVAGGAVSTLNDYTRFVRMLLADGRWHGEQVLGRKAIDEMLRDQVPPRVVVRAPAGADDARYGLGTWIEMDGDEVVRLSDPGAFGFTPWIAPDRSHGGVFAVRDRGAVVRRQLRPVFEAIDAAVVSPQVVGTAETVQLRHGGRDRRYHLHVPPHDQNQAGLPLLLVLHGGGGNGEHARAVTGLDKVGIEKGFVVAFPDGTGRLPKKLLTWNAGGIDVYAARNDIDDVDFCKTVVADIQKRVAIDASRVYVTGHSNGGMMCHRLAREAADVFQGIAPVAGAMNLTGVDASTPIAVLMIHGSKDEHVRIGGGETGAGRSRRVDASLQDAVDYYVERNGLLAYPDEAARGGVRVAKYVRKKGDEQPTPVWVVTLEGGGHAWPGAQQRPRLLQDRPFEWPASRAIVEFFASLGSGDLQDHLTPSVPR